MRRQLLGLLFAVTAILAAPAARGDEGGRCWVATWGAAVQAPLFAPAPTFQNQTLRQIVHTTVAGRAVRVRFSNAIGALPLTIDAASVGSSACSTISSSSTNCRLTTSNSPGESRRRSGRTCCSAGSSRSA